MIIESATRRVALLCNSPDHFWLVSYQSLLKAIALIHLRLNTRIVTECFKLFHHNNLIRKDFFLMQQIFDEINSNKIITKENYIIWKTE